MNKKNQDEALKTILSNQQAMMKFYAVGASAMGDSASLHDLNDHVRTTGVLLDELAKEPDPVARSMDASDARGVSAPKANPHGIPEREVIVVGIGDKGYPLYHAVVSAGITKDLTDAKHLLRGGALILDGLGKLPTRPREPIFLGMGKHLLTVVNNETIFVKSVGLKESRLTVSITVK